MPSGDTRPLIGRCFDQFTRQDCDHTPQPISRLKVLFNFEDKDDEKSDTFAQTLPLRSVRKNLGERRLGSLIRG